jgi:hypothetical protein
MQTVLQELISELKSIESYDPIVQGIIKRAESKLEKEKQQITKAYNSAIPFKFGEEYYNQTYNQNKTMEGKILIHVTDTKVTLDVEGENTALIAGLASVLLSEEGGEFRDLLISAFELADSEVEKLKKQ